MPDIGGNRRDLLAPNRGFRARLGGHARVRSRPLLSYTAPCTATDRHAVLVNAIFTCPVILPCQTHVSPTPENISLKDQKILRRIRPRWSDGRSAAKVPMQLLDEAPDMESAARRHPLRTSINCCHGRRHTATVGKWSIPTGFSRCSGAVVGMTGGNRAADESPWTLLQARRG